MPVHKFLEHVGDRSLVEMHFRVAIANGLDISLDELEGMPARELDDWILLYDVEAEAAAQDAENQRRRRDQ